MDLLLTYDVDTTTAEGRRRLRQMAKLCEGYGARVQKSVFEIICDKRDLLVLTDKARRLMDETEDSVRIYRLPKDGLTNVQSLGAGIDPGHRDAIVL